MAGRVHHRYYIFDTDNGFCGIAWNAAELRAFSFQPIVPTPRRASSYAALLRPSPISHR